MASREEEEVFQKARTRRRTRSKRAGDSKGTRIPVRPDQRGTRQRPGSSPVHREAPQIVRNLLRIAFRVSTGGLDDCRCDRIGGSRPCLFCSSSSRRASLRLASGRRNPAGMAQAERARESQPRMNGLHPPEIGTAKTSPDCREYGSKFLNTRGGKRRRPNPRWDTEQAATRGKKRAGGVAAGQGHRRWLPERTRRPAPCREPLWASPRIGRRTVRTRSIRCCPASGGRNRCRRICWKAPGRPAVAGSSCGSSTARGSGNRMN